MNNGAPLLASLLLASACGTTPLPQAAPTRTPEKAPVPSASTDPAAAARARFENPGGMWMPRQMREHAAILASLGVSLSPAALGNPTAAPLSAVVSLGGCTGSFVSKDGLIVTNHHCVQGALQLNSTPEQNLVETGFLARTRREEKSAGPAQRVYVAQKITDVTGAVRAGIEKIADGKARFDEMEKRRKEIVAHCEKDRPGIKCRVSGFFKDTEFQLIEYLEIRDVRLVYAPSRDIGNYGGEIDNWAWPRHTGDFSFYRAYVGKEGLPADYSSDNQPFHPPATLEIDPAGVSAHDFVFVAGYPGLTHRIQTAAETRHAATFSQPRYVEKAKAKLDLMAELHKAGGETAIKAGVMRQRLQNGLEKYEGILTGVAKGGLLGRKDREDAEFAAWGKATAQRAPYAEAFQALAAKQDEVARAEIKNEALRDVIGGSALLDQAILISRWVEERQKPDPERKPGFQDRDWSSVEGAQKSFAKRFDSRVDRAIFRYALGRALKAGAAEETWLRRVLGAKQAPLDGAMIDRALDAWYGATKLAAEDTRLALLRAKPKELARSKDPFVALGVLLAPMVKDLEREVERMTGELATIYPAYVEGALAWKGGMMAPDANGTLRLSYGTVRGYRAAPDAAPYAPFTKATEIPRKNTGKEPFNAPPKLLEAIAAKRWGAYAPSALGEVPVDFLTDLDITGGNSGSPVIDGKGHLVGLAFDGNYEGLASDVVFNGENTRTISCDVRYLLWVMQEVADAEELLRELGVQVK